MDFVHQQWHFEIVDNVSGGVDQFQLALVHMMRTTLHVSLSLFQELHVSDPKIAKQHLHGRLSMNSLKHILEGIKNQKPKSSVFIPRNSPVHNFRSCLRKHFFTSFDLKSDVSENYRSHRSKAQAMIDQLVKKAILLPFREVRDYQRLQGSNRTRKLMPSHIITKSNVT